MYSHPPSHFNASYAPTAAPSPFVQFSSATMEEHQRTLDRLGAQLELIAKALADLDGEDARHSTEHSRAVELMAREQDEIIRRAMQCKDMAAACAGHIREEEGRAEVELQALGAREAEAVAELRQLEDLEQEMTDLEHSAKERLMATQNQIGIFTQALRDGLQILEGDASEVRRIMSTTNATLSHDPVSTSRAIARSPPRREGYSVGSYVGASRVSPLRDVSRSSYPTPSAALVSVAPAVVSPTRSGRHHQYMADATIASVVAPNLSATSQQPSGELRIPGSQELLNACARVPMDPNEITFLLRQSQAAVNALDQLDNTPLHIACMNPAPSLDAIHALLLAGANANAKNSAGLSAFHVACLNFRGDTAADDHRLKRFLIFKGAQNPNQRTSRGETAAHLCAEDDRHFDTLVFLLSAGVDAAAPAMLSGPSGNSQMTAVDVARAGGARSAKNFQFLSALRGTVGLK